MCFESLSHESNAVLHSIGRVCNVLFTGASDYGDTEHVPPPHRSGPGARETGNGVKTEILQTIRLANALDSHMSNTHSQDQDTSRMPRNRLADFMTQCSITHTSSLR
jgi:hypothetical protein